MAFGIGVEVVAVAVLPVADTWQDLAAALVAERQVGRVLEVWHMPGRQERLADMA